VGPQPQEDLIGVGEGGGGGSGSSLEEEKGD